MTTRQVTLGLVILTACPNLGLALMSVVKRGTWPSDWPQELEPCRERAETWTGPILPKGPLAETKTFYKIPFSQKDDFEKVWPALLKVKSDGAPLTLRSTTEGSAAVRVRGWVTPNRQAGHAIELHVDGEVIDLNRIRLPADTPVIDERRLPSPQSQPSTQPFGEHVRADEGDDEGQWGPGVDGVQCRLRAEKTVWQTGAWPKFQADLRNQGKRRLSLGVAPESWKVEVDGVWYHATVTFGGAVRNLLLPPGKQENGIRLLLIEQSKWRSKQNRPLAFKPGEHTVRFALELSPEDEGRSVSVVSNPVEVTIEPALPGAGLSSDKAIKE